MRYANRWEMPEVTFYQVTDHGFEAHRERPLYAYGKPGQTNDHGVPKTGELFESLDRAMVSWVAEKYTGARGAGGTGVGTAADWFMRMIGADQLVEAGTDGRKALGLAWQSTEHCPPSVRARAIETGLENQGYVIAQQNHR